MNSPAAAIAWEIWRKNRHGFLLLFVFLLFCAGLGRLAAHFAAQAAQLAATASPDATELLEANTRASDLREFAIGWSGVLLGLSLLITLVVFALAESTALRGFSGVPSRLFTLPVRTGLLIAVPMALGAGFVALLYFTWSRFIFGSLLPILPADAQMPDGYFLLLLPATLAWFQTLVWILPGFPRTRATLLILLITTVSVLSELPFGELNRWPERKAALMAIYAILVVTAPFAAWLGVTRVRKGEWHDWPALTALMDRIANVFSRRRDFASPASALFWIECRRNGRLALGGLAIVIFFILGLNAIVLLSDGKDSAVLASALVPVILFVNVIWTPVLGLMVSGDVASRRLPLTTFQATRPVAVGELVSAKLKAMIAIWFGGWLMAAISVGVWVACCGQFDESYKQLYLERGTMMALIVVGFFSLHSLIGLFPLWLTGRVPGLPWSFVGLLIVYAGLGNIIGWIDRHPDFRDAALLLIGFAAALKLGIAFLAFRRALKQKLAKRGFVFGSVSIWIVGTAFCLWFALSIAERNNWDELLVPAFAVLLFPLARIALAPLATAMNRHR